MADLLKCEECQTPLKLTKLKIKGEFHGFLQCPICNTLEPVSQEDIDIEIEEKNETPKGVNAVPPEALERYDIDCRQFDQSLFGFCQLHDIDVNQLVSLNFELLKDPNTGYPSPHMFTILKPGTKLNVPPKQARVPFNAQTATNYMFAFPTTPLWEPEGDTMK